MSKGYRQKIKELNRRAECELPSELFKAASSKRAVSLSDCRKDKRAKNARNNWRNEDV